MVASLSLSAEPHFLHAIDYGNYVYFFLSEIAVEYTTLGKVPQTGANTESVGLSHVVHVVSVFKASVFKREKTPREVKTENGRGHLMLISEGRFF